MWFTVTWCRTARDELARIWLMSPDRRAVTDAANQIDLSLSIDPTSQGEEFYGDYLLVVPPLSVTDTVRADDRIVEILQIWHL